MKFHHHKRVGYSLSRCGAKLTFLLQIEAQIGEKGLCVEHWSYFAAPEQHHGTVHNASPVSAAIHASIVDTQARVTIKQAFKNLSVYPQEVSYTCPLPKGAAVSAFSATIDGSTLKASVKEEKTTDKSEESSPPTRAFLSEQAADGIFKCPVGSLEPGKDVNFVFTYVTELAYGDDMDRDKIMFNLATYAPGDPQRRNVIGYDDSASPHITFTSEVTTTFPLVKIEGNCDILVEGKNATAIISQGKTFHMKIAVKDAYSPIGLAERDGKGTVVSFSFRPNLMEAEKAEKINTEIIFLIDRSLSHSVPEVNKMVEMLLRALPKTCRFNIVDFGDTYTLLWPKSVGYASKTFTKAMRSTQEQKFDTNGGSFFAPLSKIMSTKPSQGVSRQIFLLTDGALDDYEECTEMVKRHSLHTRVFTFGFGNSDEKLLRSVAEATRGRCEIINESNFHTCVMRQMNRALKPSVNQLRIDWGNLKRIVPLAELKRTPHHLPPIYSGDHVTFYVRLMESDMSRMMEKKVTASIKGKLGKKNWSQKLTVDLSRVTKRTEENQVLIRLYGRSMIDGLQSGRSYLHRLDGSPLVTMEDVNREITEISLSTGIRSHLTALVISENSSGILPVFFRLTPVADDKSKGVTVEAARQMTSLSASKRQPVYKTISYEPSARTGSPPLTPNGLGPYSDLPSVKSGSPTGSPSGVGPYSDLPSVRSGSPTGSPNGLGPYSDLPIMNRSFLSPSISSAFYPVGSFLQNSPYNMDLQKNGRSTTVGSNYSNLPGGHGSVNNYACLPSNGMAPALMTSSQPPSAQTLPPSSDSSPLIPRHGKSEESPAENQQRCNEILSTQTPDGYFDKSAATLFHTSLEELKVSYGDKMDPLLLLTAVVVEYFEKRMERERDTWMLAVRKAKNWMNQKKPLKAAWAQEFVQNL
ncbi:hypothetical protein PROFUN_06951 [Planoprotostelium fungivorum]|uniref:VWFA domain-containing protein n=1 Tax=Planoprotostelium fungivorum TaxID=1890364 RepID=A0A2P6NN76_9EUKA|nr:hypothetical protein PROFUN_06951 [Planoprotostelium fungivorum]